jgi:hypothetical protein
MATAKPCLWKWEMPCGCRAGSAPGPAPPLLPRPDQAHHYSYKVRTTGYTGTRYTGAPTFDLFKSQTLDIKAAPGGGNSPRMYPDCTYRASQMQLLTRTSGPPRWASPVRRRRPQN